MNFKEQIKESAILTKEIYDSFIEVGFSEDQAFKLLDMFLKSANFGTPAVKAPRNNFFN